MADIKFSQFALYGDCQVGDIVVGLRAGDNAQFTFPGTGIADSNANLLLGYTSVGAGAVNYVSFENAVTTTAPVISAKGTDFNINLQLSSKGTGSVALNNVLVDSSSNVSNVATVMFTGSSSGQAILKAQATAGTPTLQLPNESGILALTSDLPTLPLALNEGGTGAALTASNGGIFYSNASTGAILSGTATAHQVLLSGSSSAPSWSNATYPVSITINQLLYSSSANAITGLTAANSAALVSGSSGTPIWSNSIDDGYIIIGSTGAQPQAAQLTQGSGITITNGPNSIEISSSTGGGGLIWSVVAGTTQTAAAGNGYITSNGSLTTVSLPASCAPGDMVAVQGQGAGGWLIQANTGQTIHIGASASMSAGSVASANQYDAITLVCIVTNTDWAMYGPVSSGFVIT
ncbi:hypothetical protein UFOVP270_25 [uncultured Caudovirales phage]|jgi:hypothetical protein|uniref:Uncharacterized protein n=1 Tax=uncultured Caudovirales phage TaxID=2100421 RepID=A0A6J5L522_9CAUD|nr:hypothetical protein UFOVP101_31 [uncultured Caudovirales phage]CAB4134170.1 hypothetical protein UFOVP270_25 [uncultured Caudovirales phage]